MQGVDKLRCDPIETATFRKIAWRLLPLLILGCVLNVLDRSNVAYAALQMNQDLGLTSVQFGLGSGSLMLGYCAFEVPSNLALFRFGVRRWLGCIMIVWGLVAACSALISGPRSFYVLRICLGVAEAGFFPGVLFLMSMFFPADHRARMMAILLLGMPMAHVIGAPLSGVLLGLDDFAGFAGWRWVFIVEGLPSVLLGLVVFRLLPDRPAEARWLTVEERIVAEDCLASEPRYNEITHFWAALADRRVLVLAVIQLGFTTGAFGLGIWLPQIVKATFHSDLTVGVVVALPFIVASVGTLVWASAVDRNGGDVGNLIFACGMAAIGLLLSVAFASFWLSFFWVSVASLGISAARVIFWTIPARFLSGVAAAGALAFINSVGTLGGFVGPAVIGWLKEATGSFSAGMAAMAGCLIMSSVLAFAMASLLPRT